MCKSEKAGKEKRSIPSSGSSILGFWGWRQGAGSDVRSDEGGRITACLGFGAEAAGDSCEMKDDVKLEIWH